MCTHCHLCCTRYPFTPDQSEVKLRRVECLAHGHNIETTIFHTCISQVKGFYFDYTPWYDTVYIDYPGQGLLIECIQSYHLLCEFLELPNEGLVTRVHVVLFIEFN